MLGERRIGKYIRASTEGFSQCHFIIQLVQATMTQKTNVDALCQHLAGVIFTKPGASMEFTWYQVMKAQVADRPA